MNPINLLPVKVQPYAKAVAAFVVPGIAVIVGAVTPGSDAGSTITVAEWVTAIGASVATCAAAYVTPARGYITPAEEPYEADVPVNGRATMKD